MSKEIDLSRKTITEDKNGNASITGRVSTEGAIVDAKDLTTKEYVDNAIAQAAIGGEVDTSGFALKTELPTKTSQLTNDSGFMTSIPDEYVTNSELEQTLIPYGQELDKKSNIINYSDHTLNGVETYNNLEKLNTSEISETEVVYIIDKSINLTKGSICSIEVKFSDNTNLLLQGEVVSNVLNQKEVNYIQIMGQTPMGIMLIDKAKYSIGDNNTTSIQHNDNASTLMVLHPNANNVISLTITKPTVFEINNSFFTNYQFVNDTEKENWNNKADKSEIPNIEGLASESFVNQQISEAQEEVDYKIINSKLWYDISNEIEIDLAERNYNAYIPNTRFNVDDYVYTVLNTSLNLEKDTCYYLVIGIQKETGVSAIITGEYPVITQEITDGIIYAVCDSRTTVYDNCDYVNGELIKADGKSVIKIKNAFSYPIKVARMSVMPTKYVPITDDFFNSHKFVSEEQLSQISTTYEQLNLKADKSELFSKDYNDLTNKPCYDTRITENVVLEIDKDMDLSNYETKDILVIPDGSYYYKLVKLRPAYPGDIDNMKESGTLTIGENTMSIKEAIDIDPDDNYGEGVELILEFLIIVERDEFNYFPGDPIESGIWMLHSAYIIDENGELVEQASGVELYDGMIIRYDSLSSGELRQLDKKFIPESIATKLYVDQSISQVNEDLQNQINELFQNVSSGKELIASAITDKGVDASEEETFQSLSEKINQIPVGPPGSNIIGYINENNDIYVSLTELESGTYTLKFEDYTGLLNEFDDIGTVEV